MLPVPSLKQWITIFFLAASAETVSAFTVKIDLFNQFNIKTLVVSPIEGKYQFSTENGNIYRLKKNQIVYFTLVADSLSVWDQDQHLGVFKTIFFEGIARQNSFKAEPAYPALGPRYYEGNLIITNTDQQFKITNLVDIESYLAGVVEAEAGPKAPFEFYKSQAIISRTYLLEQISRQGINNYVIGDDVYHQVYKGMSLKNSQIKQAVLYTAGLVIVDSSYRLITAAFHSNSGGKTINSEDVWLNPTSYLKAIEDPFSLEQKNTSWTDTIPVNDWLKYLQDNGLDIDNDVSRIDNLYFEQPQRLKYYMHNDDTLPLKKIRQDFGFRSTWFSMKPEGNYILVEGRGYGHGVGLSQEGAMQMARQNYSFIDIINFYYKDIKVVDYKQIIPTLDM
ncbi:MAG: SpoIID/LytB domain-containing protein [Salinivirgaceae bacterium]|nr:SpoIID/LytB domain-containing protein [Salinivirgaceae bacterium]